MEVIEESQLIALFNIDYSKAFTMLFSQFYTPMHRVAARYVNEEIADDIVHDVFITIWNNKFKCENIYILKKYIYVSVKNRCLNEMRKSKYSSDYIKGQSIETSFEESIIEEDLLSQLLSEVNKLPENYRIAIELSLKGDSLENIANKMNTTIPAIKAYKNKGKILLRKTFKDKVLFILIANI